MYIKIYMKKYHTYIYFCEKCFNNVFFAGFIFFKFISKLHLSCSAVLTNMIVILAVFKLDITPLIL